MALANSWSSNPYSAGFVPRRYALARSALFGVGFALAIFLLVVSSLYSVSDNPARKARVLYILIFDLALIIILGFYLAYEVITRLFVKSPEQLAPLLHRRFVLTFSLIALLPAIIVGAFSTTLISRNITDLYGENISGTIKLAGEVLNLNVGREMTDLGADIDFTENNFLNPNQRFLTSRITYTAFINRFARSRDYDALYILARDGDLLAQYEKPNAPQFRIPVPAAFAKMDQDPNIVHFQDRENYIIGLKKLTQYDNAYLYVGKTLDPNSQVLSRIAQVESQEQALTRYEQNQDFFNRVFFLTFIETALLILFAAIWLGFALANRIIQPMERLVQAAERIRDGDLNARVDMRGDWAEMSDVGSAFNRMTQQLRAQREELVAEHDISEQRRQFSEAVLSGVRAGVMGLTEDGRITLMNDSAERLLNRDAQDWLGYPIEQAFPAFSRPFMKARESLENRSEDQIEVDVDDDKLSLNVRVAAYTGAREDTGWVVTFDDMTRLVAAQRHSAWREVARRIAHEIKNPLTPIQLSAERLKRRYAGKIDDEKGIFENCTNTIIRQVETLESMVDTFSAFAKTPAPELGPTNIKLLVEEVLFAQHVSYPDVEFKFSSKGPEKAYGILCDTRLFSQALTNLYINAAEAISRRIDNEGRDDFNGIIQTDLSISDDVIMLDIVDNGPGWPTTDKDRLLEPYVTTRDQGTGLGLAIVKRIIEDHNGRIELRDRSDELDGAHVHIDLPQNLNTDTMLSASSENTATEQDKL